MRRMCLLSHGHGSTGFVVSGFIQVLNTKAEAGAPRRTQTALDPLREPGNAAVPLPALGL